MPGSPDLLWNLAVWSIRSFLLAAAAGLCLRIFRVRDASARLTVWTVVLCGALALPLLSTFAPALDIPVPRWQAGQPAAAIQRSPHITAPRTFKFVPAPPVEKPP